MVLLDLTSPAAPGYTPLLATAALGVLIVFLFFSMRKQLRRIDVPVDDEHPDSAPFATDAPGTDPSA